MKQTLNGVGIEFLVEIVIKKAYVLPTGRRIHDESKSQ